MSARPGLSFVVLALAAAGLSCSGVRLPDSVGAAVRAVDTAHQTDKLSREVKQLGDSAGKCSRLGKQEIAFDEERAIGETAAIDIAAENGGLVGSADPADPKNAPVRYLNVLGRKLADRSERPNLTWTFAVIDSPEVNAFSTPGGLVLVTRGLLQQVKNEAQLAGVLAHEIGHVTGRHALNRYRAFKESACNNALVAGTAAKAVADVAQTRFLAALDSDVGHLDFDKEGGDTLLGRFGTQMAHSLQSEKFDPAAEKQADYDAVSLMVATGYQPEEYAKLLAGLPETFQAKTHPPKKERVENVRATLRLFADPQVNPLRCAGAPFGESEGFKAPPLDGAVAEMR